MQLNKKEFSERPQDDEAESVLTWAFKKFGSRVGIASSFGAEDVVLIDMALKIDPFAKIFTLDTGRLHQETYEVMDAIRDRYGIAIEICFPEEERVKEVTEKNGFNLFYRNTDMRKLCCIVRKVEPLQKKLKDLDAWVCGLRQEQAITRAAIGKVEFDPSHRIVKVNPLADWTNADVWDYIRKNNVPYNKLHDRGFPSIGCAPCTRAIGPHEDIRAGRWWWEEPASKECGLHVGKSSS
jgi:phosphoadenosine phosphosulfate reductase